jgi:multidrug transporter EmrE-like cation transporter
MTVSDMIGGFVLLAQALKRACRWDTVYAVWTGIEAGAAISR